MNKSIYIKIGALTCLFLILLIMVVPRDHKLSETGHRHGHSEPHVSDDIFEYNDASKDDEDLTEEFELAKELLTDEKHSAGREERAVEGYNIVCNKYADICSKINRKAEYNISERYAYTLMMVYLIDSIDKNIELETTKSLRSTISKIEMYQHAKDRRGGAGASSVKINTQKIGNIREFWEVWTHEVGGHILDIGTIHDQNPPLHKTFTEFGRPTFGLKDRSLKFYSISWLDENTRKKDSSYRDFVSGYAMRDIFEEFAEFANAWINHHDLLVEMTKTNNKLKKKYELFEELFGDWYFDADTDALKRFTPSDRVFDSTKEWKS